MVNPDKTDLLDPLVKKDPLDNLVAPESTEPPDPVVMSDLKVPTELKENAVLLDTLVRKV